MIERIAQILEDLFGIPKSHVEASDDLAEDWGMDGEEIEVFMHEFSEEFGVGPTGFERTIEDYARLVN